MKLILGAFVLGLFGCGGGGDPLEGTWLISGSICNVAAGFDGGEYTISEACQLNNGAIGQQVETGTYSLAGSNFTTMSEQATCAGHRETVSQEFDISGDSLTIVTDTGALIFIRQEQPPVISGISTFGCFDANGNFTPRPLGPLQ